VGVTFPPPNCPPNFARRILPADTFPTARFACREICPLRNLPATNFPRRTFPDELSPTNFPRRTFPDELSPPRALLSMLMMPAELRFLSQTNANVAEILLIAECGTRNRN
jgi:hypothetical protein